MTVTELLKQHEANRPKKQRRPTYRKPDSIKELERLHFERKRAKYPDMPYPVHTTFRDDTANGLTACIVAYLTLNGHFAARVNTTGTYSAKLGRYIHSGSRKGMADITAVINGKHVSIEVKHGRDRLREEQNRVKQEIERAGGVYIVATTFDDFIKQFNSFLI